MCFSEILHVVLQDTAVHDDLQTCGTGPSGSGFIHYTQLHPNNASPAADGRLHNIRNVFGPAEDVDDFKWFGDFVQSRVRFFTKNFGFEWIHWNDPIPCILHVSGNRIARSPWVRRQSNNCNRSVPLENLLDAHNTLSKAARKAWFCSCVPTDTRIHAGQPHAGRTITP